MTSDLSFKGFHQDKGGAVAILLAALALPVLTSVAVVGQYSQNRLDNVNLHSWAKEACQRVNSEHFASKPLSYKEQAAKEVLAARTAGQQGISFDVSSYRNKISVSLESSSPGSNSTVTQNCQESSSGSQSDRSPNSVFFEDFEAVDVRASQGVASAGSGTYFYVYPEYQGWVLEEGPGVEIQYVSSMDNQIAEFDSSDRLNMGAACSDCGLNTEISHQIELSPGTYELSFLYSVNINRSLAEAIPTPREDDMIIITLKRDNGSPTGGSTDEIVFSFEQMDHLTNPQWIPVSHTFTLSQSDPGYNGDTYHLHFAGAGPETRHGGMIDNIEIIRVR